MGMGWKSCRGGLYSKSKCKCGKGEIIIYVSDHQESEYPPFERGDDYTAETTCPDNCINVEILSQHNMKYSKS